MNKVVPLEGFGGGGSSPLNFKIVAYATEEELAAARPKENTIGIVTTTPINGWSFNATEPTELMEGMVWFTTGTSSSVAFNAFKKNDIQVYPISAKQYVSGAWVDVTAKSYQNGEWVDWVTHLYNRGDDCYEITTGYHKVYAKNGSLTWGTDHAKFSCTGSSARYVSIYSHNRFNVDNFSILRVKLINTGVSGYVFYAGLCSQYSTSTDLNAVKAAMAAYNGTSATGTEEVSFDVDISALTGYFHLQVFCGAPNAKLTEVCLTNQEMS